MIKLDVSSLKVTSSDTIRSEFLALVHDIPRMIVSDKKKIKDVFGIYNSGNLPIL
jgi:hypothetical protein